VKLNGWDKHSSLLGYGNNYSRKKFYSIDLILLGDIILAKNKSSRNSSLFCHSVGDEEGKMTFINLDTRKQSQLLSSLAQGKEKLVSCIKRMLSLMQFIFIV
jgi:hypothetical protein